MQNEVICRKRAHSCIRMHHTSVNRKRDVSSKHVSKIDVFRLQEKRRFLSLNSNQIISKKRMLIRVSHFAMSACEGLRVMFFLFSFPFTGMEQFEQLLTCAICLDRYRNPKLLPCQHSFCMEPCMDGLVDYVRRQVKCPECRAEHRIPYQVSRRCPPSIR